jgi:hypothetical protein
VTIFFGDHWGAPILEYAQGDTNTGRCGVLPLRPSQSNAVIKASSVR